MMGFQSCVVIGCSSASCTAVTTPILGNCPMENSITSCTADISADIFGHVHPGWYNQALLVEILILPLSNFRLTIAPSSQQGVPRLGFFLVAVLIGDIVCFLPTIIDVYVLVSYDCSQMLVLSGTWLSYPLYCMPRLIVPLKL